MSLAERTVGVIERNDEQSCRGYNLMSVSSETYLFDYDGRVVNQWHSDRNVFCSYLLPNGNLLRDGSDTLIATAFRTGGAAGFVEEVTWEGERVWSFCHEDCHQFLSHHDLEILPNGNILILSWERKTKEECLAAGRRPELIPDGEVWDNLVLELQPDRVQGTAEIIWKWSMWDHLIQDFDSTKANFGSVRQHPERFDVNFCPAGGKAACRDQTLLRPENAGKKPAAHSPPGVTGERDWLHINAVSYDRVRDQVIISLNVPGEIVIIDHGTTLEESRETSGGRRGKGGDILYRWGNPMAYRHGTRMEQKCFCQHSVQFVRSEGVDPAVELPGAGHVMLFNNGRFPDRHWSTVDEIILPEVDLNSGVYVREEGRPYGPAAPVWKYGATVGRRDSFYCTHISGCQRLKNGNTLITQGPQGIVMEVTPTGDEVWRYVCPVVGTSYPGMVQYIRQGSTNFGPNVGSRSLFRVIRYDEDHPALKDRELIAGRYLEA